MLSKSSCSDKGSDSRQKPKCTRCRNHGIYPVPLKGHRNVCPYKMCNCKHCILILERRLVSMKPESQTEGVREKSSKKKKTAKKTKQADVAEKKNMKEVTFSVLLLFCYTSLIRSLSTTWTYHNIEYGVFANIYFVNNS